MIGEMLGQYRIDARLGAGGMGVVYRARDERLHRTVALKLIGTEGRGSTPDERARLLDEARAASHLTHPHICTVYEVGEIEGRVFIAMEFVEGQPLPQLVPADGLPAETVVRYGEQIAAALAHAHERGVIHRDLKTANITINPGSGAKVLDFGLARRTGGGDVDGTTQSIAMADPGVLVGTLAYVAPEVLLGHGADARSDIWALGVVLYEMATGQLPFQGRNEYDLTAAILRSPAQPFPPHVPPILRTIILRSVAKEPAQRYQRAGEARAALEAIRADLIVSPAVDRQRRTHPRNWMIAAGGLAIAVTAVAAWLLVQNRDGYRESAPSGGRLTRVVSSQDRTFDPAISPDERMLAYIAESPPGQVDLYAGRISGGARIRLTEDRAREETPRFSPDGDHIAFTVVDARGLPAIRILPTLGGAPLATIPEAADAAWSPDGRRLAYLQRRADGKGNELAVSAADGSDARAILRSDSQYPFLRHPAWSPDGQTIAVVRGTGGIAGEMWLVPTDGGPPRAAIHEPETVFSDWPSFTSDGRGLVHASNRGGATNIWWLPLSGGAPVRVTTGSGPDESPSVGKDGTIAYVNSRWQNTLDVHDLQKRSFHTLLTHSPFIWAPAVSPDGSEIAFSRSDVDGAWHIWTVAPHDRTVRQLTSGPAGEVYPRYSQDGASLFFHTWNAPRRVGRVPRAGGPATWPSFGDEVAETFADPSPNGKVLAFVRADPDAERIYIAPAGGGAARRLISSRGTLPRWSPDGSTIAFASDRRYDGGIFIIRADGSGERQLTKEGGWPVWWPDGSQIGYIAVGPNGNGQIRVVAPRDGTTRTLDGVLLAGLNHPFAVFPDGQRLVVGNAVHVSDEIWVIEPRR